MAVKICLGMACVAPREGGRRARLWESGKAYTQKRPMAKIGTDRFKPNEIYKVHQEGRGLRKFGHGTMAVWILKSTAEEVVVEHAGEGRRHGRPQPIATKYRVLPGKP